MELIKIVARLKILLEEEFKGLFWFCLFNVMAFLVIVVFYYVYFQKGYLIVITDLVFYKNKWCQTSST